MTDPTENEEINEELSTDELKSVSGGYTDSDIDPYRPGSGSGMLITIIRLFRRVRRKEE